MNMGVAGGAGQVPISVRPTADLVQLGISPSNIRFGALTMESDHYICVRDTGSDGAPVVVMIDLHDNNKV